MAHAMRGPLGCLAAFVVFMRTWGCWDVSGSRACACCGSMPCGIRARDQCALGSRSAGAGELACA
eukprot:1196018-Prymnesium_polylepis.1